MKTSDFCRFALGICAVAAMLGGCGSRSDNGAVLPSNGAVPPVGANKGIPHHRSFYYTGREQRFRVPAGVKSIGVVARGGGGADGDGSTELRAAAAAAYMPLFPSLRGRRWQSTSAGKGRE